MPAAAGTEPNSPDQIFQEALNLPSDRQIYFNVFVNNLGASDIATVLMLDGKTTALLRMSYTTAKTYAILLNQAVVQLENATGNKIMIAPEIAQKMSASSGEGDS